MNFGVNLRKRHRQELCGRDNDKLDFDFDTSIKKAKIELEGEVTLLDSYKVDCCVEVKDSTDSRSSSPVLFDMEKDKLKRPPINSPRRLRSNKQTGKEEPSWSIPKDILTYRSTRQLIDPFNVEEDVEEIPLINKRLNRSCVANSTLDFNYLSELPMKEAKKIIIADFDATQIIISNLKKSSTKWEWAKPIVGGIGSLGVIPRVPQVTDSLSELEVTAPEVEFEVDNTENVESEMQRTPELGECSSGLPSYQASQALESNVVLGSQLGFELRLDSDSDSDFQTHANKQPKKKLGKAKKASQQSQNVNIKRQKSNNSEPQSTLLNEPKQLRSRTNARKDYTVFTPVAGRKLISRIQDDDVDEYNFENAVFQSTKTYSSAASTNSQSGTSNQNQKMECFQCPICSKMFNSNVIESHASECQFDN